MKRFMIGLVLCIPLASVVLGAVMIYLAVHSPDADIEATDTPLSKTSWRQEQQSP